MHVLSAIQQFGLEIINQVKTGTINICLWIDALIIVSAKGRLQLYSRGCDIVCIVVYIFHKMANDFVH